MTKIPLFSLPLRKSKSRSMAMAMASAAATHSPSSEEKSQWPVPLTPPYPPLSKEVEMRRAMAASDRSSSLPLPMELQLLLVFEDEWLCVVNKPAGIYCEAILSHLSTSSNKQQNKLHLANRLDRDTSGLMLLTKHNRAAAALVQSFTRHAVSKTYLALSLAPAPAPTWRRAHISSGHGRSKHGAWRVYSLPDVDRTLPGGSRVKRMETAFEVLSINGTSTSNTDTENEVRSIVVGDNMFASAFQGKEDDDHTNTNNNNNEVLLRAYPKSGRTHQIRLHCQYLGLPLRGDVKYGGVSHCNGVECDSHALHAETLSFMHPITGVPLNFKAPPPPWLQSLLPTLL